VTLTWETNIGIYCSRIRGRLFTILNPIVQPGSTIARVPVCGGTLLNLDIVFRDGSMLKVGETLVKDRDRVTLLKYTYEYRRPSGFFFSYDMEREPESTSKAESETQRRATQLKKPLCHLHVGAEKGIEDLLEDFPAELREHDGPHYETYPVCLDYILAVIIVNYFPEQRDVFERLNLADFVARQVESEHMGSN